MKKKNNLSQKMDKTAFWQGDFAQARQRSLGKDLSPQKRIQLVWEMLYRQFDFSPENPPRLDRTAFSKRGRN